MMKDHKIIIATGGTGGHLFPAKQLADRLNERKISVIFAGNKKRFLKEEDENFFLISSSSIKKKNLPIAAIKIFYGVLQSIKLIKKFKPSLVVAFGGFYCFPILLASKILRVPYVLYEPNVICGMVNRLFSKSALALAVQFKETINHKSQNIIAAPFLPWKKIEHVQKENVRTKLGLEKDRFTLLVFGGSQGAFFLNELILKVIEKIKNQNIQIIHITGNEKTSKLVKLKYEELKIPAYVSSFVEDIPFFCYGADLAICRSGGATLGDLIQTSTPSILIPYPFASDDHQHQNAKILQDKVKGAYIVLQKDLTEQKLISAIGNFRHNNCSKLQAMRKNLNEFYNRENKDRLVLAKVIEEICLKKIAMS